MTHERFALPNTVSEIKVAVCVDEAYPVVAPPIAEHFWVVIPKDLVMCPVHLLPAGQQTSHRTYTTPRVVSVNIVSSFFRTKPQVNVKSFACLGFKSALQRLGCQFSVASYQVHDQEYLPSFRPLLSIGTEWANHTEHRPLWCLLMQLLNSSLSNRCSTIADVHMSGHQCRQCTMAPLGQGMCQCSCPVWCLEPAVIVQPVAPFCANFECSTSETVRCCYH
jgi:hypothetical protein